MATYHAIGARPVLVAPEFGFFLVGLRVLLDLPANWRELVPGAAVCTVAATGPLNQGPPSVYPAATGTHTCYPYPLNMW